MNIFTEQIMSQSNVFGAVIDDGPSNWQVFQQGPGSCADIPVAGRWATNNGKALGVEVRLVREDSCRPVVPQCGWLRGTMRRNGTWSAVLRNVPAGGLYRLETRLMVQLPEFSCPFRGDMRHFIGVGDLWIIAGQSNSAGCGLGECDDPPQLGVHLFNNAMRWSLATQPLNESTDTAHPANREDGNSAHSPWLTWAKLVQKVTGFPIGLIQTSLGGSPLRLWNPTEPGDNSLYEVMLQAVAAAGGKARGVLWYQGETDAIEHIADTYERRFTAAVRAWRKALKNPKLAVLTVQLNRLQQIVDEKGNLNWTMLREAQRRVANSLAGVTIIPTLDLPLSDPIHISPHGNLLLARRAADAVLGTVYSRNICWRAPQPASAKRIRGGAAIEIAFTDAGKLGTTAPDAIPFRVEDSTGIVAVEKVEYPGGAKLRLKLGRKANGRTVIHGGYGVDPATVPYDLTRIMPILGFYGFKVE